MKKAISALLTLCILLACCSCGTDSLDTSCEKADKLLSDYSKKLTASCYYEGEYTKIQGVYCYAVIATLSQEVVEMAGKDWSIFSGATMARVSQDILEKVYPSLTNLFEPHDVDVAIFVQNPYGETYSMILRGEIHHD